MPTIAPYLQSNEVSGHPYSGRCRKTAIAFVLGKALLVYMGSPGICSDIDYSYKNSIKTAIQTEQELTDTNPRRFRLNAKSMRVTVVGTASTYNPYRTGHDLSDTQTASGEPYDPTAWTAAIQNNLREQFSGVRYGKNYRAAYALVESGDKHLIVKINDVGPLKPGRVIDLNEQSMRYFDPSPMPGLISDIKITPLSGEDWTPGPISSEQLISVAAAQ
jgi:rare lipoprotein A